MMPWGPGHLAILKLLLGNLPHIVITVWFVGVVKDDGTTCRGQYLNFYLFKKKLQRDRIQNTSIYMFHSCVFVLPGATQILLSSTANLYFQSIVSKYVLFV